MKRPDSIENNTYCPRTTRTVRSAASQRVLIAALFLGLSCPVQADNVQESRSVPKGTTEEATRLWLLVRETSQRTSRHLEDEDSLETVVRQLDSDCRAEPTEQLTARALQAEAKEMDARNGVEFRGGYTSDSFLDDEGYPRSYLELSWDVLRNGYRQNNKRAQALYRESEIAKLRYDQKTQLYKHRCRRYSLATVFAALRSQLLMLKLQLMEPIYQIERRAYFKGWSFLDDLLIPDEVLRDTRRELERLVSVLPDGTSMLEELINPPIIDVRMDRIVDAINFDDRDQKLVSLQQEAIRYSREAKNRNRLRLFLRQELDFGGAGHDRDDLVAGVRFQIPLDGQWGSEREESLPYRLQEVEGDMRLSRWERVARARSAYVEVREQYRRVVRKQFRFLRAQERLRRVLVQRDLGDDTGVALAVTRTRTLLDGGIELIRAKEELYSRVYDLFLAGRISYSPDMVKVGREPDGRYRGRFGNRAIYLWSAAFNRIPDSQLFDFFQAKGIDRVLLSAGKRVDRSKLREFIAQASNQNLAVELIVGDNNWIFPENQQRAAVTAAAMAEMTGALHLDIEPHTLPGYKANRDEYLSNYLNLIKSVRELMGDQRLTLAVPLHWPSETYSQLADIADSLYLMAYEIPEVDRLVNRVNKVLKALPPGKAVVVLRMEDFPDQWVLEQGFEKIAAQTGVRHFGIHKLGSFLNVTDKDR